MPAVLNTPSVVRPVAMACPRTAPQSRVKPMAAQGTTLRWETRWGMRPTTRHIGTSVQAPIPSFWSNGLLGRMIHTRPLTRP
jgi:hypothetical protein